MAGVSIAPPPSAITAGRSRLSVLSVSPASSTLKPASPSRRKRSGMERRTDFSISWSRSKNCRPISSATREPSVVLPAPMKPMRARWRSRACAMGCDRGTPGAPRGSPRASRRRTSRARPGRARRRPTPPATTARASTAATSLRSTSASAGSPLPRSTDRSGRISVGSGFIAARTTISSPFETPPSIPPARFVSRRSPGRISSCAWEPRSSASPKPSPISTPFTAWIPISAAARRPSRRSSLVA